MEELVCFLHKSSPGSVSLAGPLTDAPRCPLHSQALIKGAVDAALCDITTANTGLGLHMPAHEAHTFEVFHHRRNIEQILYNK